MLETALFLLALCAAVVAGFALGRQERASERRRRVDDALTAFRAYSGTWTLIARARVACPLCGATLRKVADGLHPDALLVTQEIEHLL